MAKQRPERQKAIREIVRMQAICRQCELMEQLSALGFSCTQATISRDMVELGIRKLRGGIYVLAEDLHLQRMVSDFVLELIQVNNMILVKAQPGTASAIAGALDVGEFSDCLGTIAGNDTVLIVCPGNDEATHFIEMLRGLKRSN